MRSARGSAKPRGGRSLEAHLSIPFLTAVRGGETSINVQRGEGKQENLVVKIPPGVDTGAKLRLKGQGEPGPKGGPRGDLTIVITVEPHPYFKREDRNLLVEVPISVSEAILGARIDVPSLEGNEVADHPAGKLFRTEAQAQGTGDCRNRRQAGGRPVSSSSRSSFPGTSMTSADG